MSTKRERKEAAKKLLDAADALNKAAVEACKLGLFGLCDCRDLDELSEGNKLIKIGQLTYDPPTEFYS